jgi:hypothetical protein
MGDVVTANLPAIDFDITANFYETLGFEVEFRDEEWMILSRGALEIEFFPHPKLNPSDSWFSACVYVADIDGLYQTWSEVGLADHGIPRLTALSNQVSGSRMFALVDPNGSLLRCMSSLNEGN